MNLESTGKRRYPLWNDKDERQDRREGPRGFLDEGFTTKRWAPLGEEQIEERDKKSERRENVRPPGNFRKRVEWKKIILFLESVIIVGDHDGGGCDWQGKKPDARGAKETCR